MTHLTDEQIEDVLNGRMPEPEDLDTSVRARLEDMHAIRGRLKKAFASVSASEELRRRVRANLADDPHDREAAAATRPRVIRVARRFVPALAAAAVLLVAVSVVVFVGRGQPVMGAQAQFERIHLKNLGAGDGFHADSDPIRIADHLRARLGYTPRMIALPEGGQFGGCSIADFRENSVGSYIVETPHGNVSIIVVTDPPETLAFRHRSVRDGAEFFACGSEDCKMVAVRIGEYTYAAVCAKSTHDELISLLKPLLSGSDTDGN